MVPGQHRCLLRLEAGPANSYAAANFQSVAATGDTIGNWLFTPEFLFRNGDVLSFFTRGPDTSLFPDRLEVRMSTSGGSLDVGATALSVGVYTSLLLEINPSQSLGGYPETWTE